jgi:octaprenyl-diphosphate synthase
MKPELEALVKRACAGRESLERALAPVWHDLVRSEEALAKYLASPYAYINTLCRHLESFKGKRLRPALLHLSARAFGGEAPEACAVAAVVEMFHLATLCHDDILDGADLRRGMPALNAAWGNKAAIMTGDFLLSRGFEILGKLDDPRPFHALTRIGRFICEGELLQIANRGQWDMDEDTYLDIIERKTALLFAVSAELGALLAGAKEADSRRLYVYGRRLGLAFQIVDDCLDLVGAEDSAGKSLGSDLKNSELTLPVIHLLAHLCGASKQELLSQLASGQGRNRAALAPYLARTNSVEYALHAARLELQRAGDEIKFLPASSAKSALLALPEFVLARVAGK